MAQNTGTINKTSKKNTVAAQAQPSRLDLIANPYQYFYDRYISQDEFEVKIENFNIDKIDVKSIQEQIDLQLAEAKRTKKDWLAQAMSSDPAFMLNPIEDFYKKLIPKDMLSQLTEDEIMEVISIYDPVTWGERYLLQNHGGWKPRCSKTGFPYQAQLARCRSKRIVARAGRRLGKSMSLAVRVLHKAFTFVPDKRPNYKVVIFTPNQSQIDVIFKMMEMLVDNNPALMSMVKEGRIPIRKNPNYTIELTNGAIITGFVSGSTAVRGSAADMLILDEASFLTKDDTDAVLALLTEHENVELWISSTPQGLKDYFYDRVHDPNFVSFYFPSDKYHPNWSSQMEDEFKSQLSSAGYAHEVLANFSADGQGVFQSQFIQNAIADYKYSNMTYDPNMKYSIGVDWNDSENGTQIYVVGFSVDEMRYKIVDRRSVHIEGWTQTTAVRAIQELNRKWRASIIYVDEGHGGAQIEMLHELGVKASPGSADKRLMHVKGVGFARVIETRDPWSQSNQIIKRQTKAFMVNSAVRIFESGFIDIPKEDEKLIHQLEGYKLDRVQPNGTPVYAKDEKYGDHCLDAVMIALLGFVLEYSSLGKGLPSSNIRPVALKTNEKSDPATEYAKKLQADKDTEQKQLEDARATSDILFGQTSQSITSRPKPLGVRTIGSRTRNPIIRRNNF